MFKTKLYNTIIAAGSLFYVASVPGKAIFSPAAAHLASPCPDSASSAVHAFDKEGLCVCLPSVEGEALAAAPRFSLNKQASDFVKNYISENGYFLKGIKKKSPSYFKTIESVFKKYDIPAEIKYMAVVESKLDNSAVSGVGATGLWQFMPESAKSFGLKISGKTDERRNTYKSTVAAAKCLSYLHKMFDDWLLCVAAYNCGPGGVLKAIKKSGSRDYWVLQNYLPLETRKHVKKFIATHYFFEGHGSLATMTKKQTQAHIDAVALFVKTQEFQKSDTLLVQTAPIEFDRR
jgi:membrane-bound lytic murein transglycosylase D